MIGNVFLDEHSIGKEILPTDGITPVKFIARNVQKQNWYVIKTPI